MRPLEDHLRAEGKWVETPTKEEVTIMLDSFGDLIPKKSPSDRERRLGQLKWTTFARDQRRKIASPKKSTTEEDDTNEPESKDD